MRQYRIFHKRPGTEFIPLKPVVNANLYSRPEIDRAVEHLRVTPEVQGMLLILDTGIFNLFVLDHDAIAPDAFCFLGKDDTVTINEPVDNRAMLAQAAAA